MSENVLKKIFPPGGSVLLRTVAALVTALFVFTAATAWITYRNTKADALAAQDVELAEVASSLACADVVNRIPGALTMEPETFERALEDEMKNGPQPGAEPMHGRGRGHRGMGRHRHMMRDGTCPWRGTAECLLADVSPDGERMSIPAGRDVLVRMRHTGGQAEVARFDDAVKGGFSNVSINGDEHRLCLIFLPDGSYTAVADPMSVIEEEAQARAYASVTPLLILLPILLGVVAGVLWLTFRPLQRAAEEVRNRDENRWTPLSTEKVPAETRPFVEAVNDLLARVEAARVRELRFSADAAHELRSPLTSLTIEAEHLAKLPLPEEAKPVVANLTQGLERAVHQLSQLLHFARAQAGEADAPNAENESWYLSELIGRLVEPLLDAADKKGLEWFVSGVEEEGAKEAPVEGVSSSALEAILRNLLENAVRYSPEKGCVAVKVAREADALVLSVTNDGPGIPESERERVFDPFYRIPGTGVAGTGLGLAIVKTYADRLGAVVTLEDAHPEGADERGRGLVVTVRVPMGRTKASEV